MNYLPSSYLQNILPKAYLGAMEFMETGLPGIFLQGTSFPPSVAQETKDQGDSTESPRQNICGTSSPRFHPRVSISERKNLLLDFIFAHAALATSSSHDPARHLVPSIQECRSMCGRKTQAYAAYSLALKCGSVSRDAAQLAECFPSIQEGLGQSQTSCKCCTVGHSCKPST